MIHATEKKVPERIEPNPNVEHAQLRVAHDKAVRRVTELEVQTAINATKVQAIEARLLTLITIAEFLPVKLAVYGIIGSVLAAVLTAIVAGVVSNGPHAGIR